MTRTWTPPEARTTLTRKQYADIWLRQDGRCPCCTRKLIAGKVVDEHITPLWAGGSNDLSNRALYCDYCAGKKTGKEATERGKSRRARDKAIGAKKSRNPLPGSKASGWRHRIDGTWERRS